MAIPFNEMGKIEEWTNGGGVCSLRARESRLYFYCLKFKISRGNIK